MSSTDEYCAVVKIKLVDLTLGIKTQFDCLTRIDFLHQAYPTVEPRTDFVKDVVHQLHNYFNNADHTFAIPLNPEGTKFQIGVWERLKKIPLGCTTSYGELASKLQSGARAVGNACRRNPIPIIIPCHRVVAKNTLGGYSGKTKGKLLQLKNRLIIHEGGIADETV